MASRRSTLEALSESSLPAGVNVGIPFSADDDLTLFTLDDDATVFIVA